MFYKIFNDWILLVILLISALYVKFGGPFADSIYLLVSLLGILVFVVCLFGKQKTTENYINGTYLKIVYFLFIVLLGYSLVLNSIFRLLFGATFWRVIDLVAVFSVGALALFALSNLSRVVRTLRSKEVDETKPFYVSMILRIVCFLLVIHLPTYMPSYRAKPLKNMNLSSVTANITAELSADLDTIVNRFTQEIAKQGVSLYLKKGEKLYEAQAGIVNVESQRRPSAKDYYQIASVSKVLTATLYADFLKEGVIDSQTTLADIYDTSDWTGGMADVSLISLATHTSGLPRLSSGMMSAGLKNFLNPYKFYKTAEFEQDLKTTIPLEEPVHTYSNFGYATLGQAITKVSGMDYLEGRGLLNNFKVRVAAPFGMKTITQSLGVSNYAKPSSTLKNGKSIPLWENSEILGAGTFMASLDDLKAFVNSYLTDHLQPDFGKNYTTWWATQYVSIALPGSKRTQRLGWVEQPFELQNGSSVSLYWHNGATFGNTSFVAFIPDLGLSIVVLSNTGKTVDQLAMDVMKRITME